MKALKYLLFTLLIVIFLFSFSKTSFAQNKVGVNIADKFNAIGNATGVVGQGGWIVMMPKIGDCSIVQNIMTAQQNDQNFILRLHYPDTVPNSSYAVSWAATLFQLAKQTTDVIYVYPWNEPNMPRECGGVGPAGDPNSVADDTACAPLVSSYVSELMQKLNAFGLRNGKVKVLSPMINQSHPNFQNFVNALGASFFSQFDGITMNLYDFEHTCGYTACCEGNANLNACSFNNVLSQIPGTGGKPVYAVEVGIVDDTGICSDPQVTDCPNFSDARMRPFYERAFGGSWLGAGNFAMGSSFFYNPEIPSHPVWLWGSSSEQYLRSIAGSGSTSQAGFSPTQGEAYLQTLLANQTLVNCSGTCGYATSQDLCTASGGGTGPTPVVCSDKVKGIGLFEWSYSNLWDDPALPGILSELGVKTVAFTPNFDNYYDMGAGAQQIMRERVNFLTSQGIEIIGLFVGFPGDLNNGHAGAFNGNEGLFRSKLGPFLRDFPQIKKWRVWNEPDLWGGVSNLSTIQNVDEYARVYNIFYDVAKGVSSQIKIAPNASSGGVSWLQDVISRISGYDAISYHPYDEPGTCPFINTEGILALSSYNKPLWLTEYGWNVSIGEPAQADHLKYAISWINRFPRVEHAIFFKLNDVDISYGLIEGTGLGGAKRPAYDVYKNGNNCGNYCDDALAGTCEEPLVSVAAKSCETFMVTAPITNRQELSRSGTCVPAGPSLPGLYYYDYTWDVAFEKNWWNEREDYILYPGSIKNATFHFFDNDPDTYKKVTVSTVLGNIKSAAETFEETLDPVTGRYKNVDFGVLSYISNHLQLVGEDGYYKSTYQTAQGGGLKNKKSVYLVPESNIIVSDSTPNAVATGDRIFVKPYTQAAYGGGRLEAENEAPLDFGASKMYCLLAGRPGDLGCAVVGDYNPETYFAKATQRYYAMTPEERVLASNSCGLSGGLSNGGGNQLALSNQTMLDSASSTRAMSVEDVQNSGFKIDAVSQKILNEENRAPTAVPFCFFRDSESQDILCPFSSTTGSYEESVKNKFKILGKTRVEKTCSKSGITTSCSSVGIPGDCTAEARLLINHESLPQFEGLNVENITNTFKTIFMRPGEELVIGPAKRWHNEAPATGGISIESSLEGDVYNGFPYMCSTSIANASVGRPGNSFQPDDECRTVSGQTTPPIDACLGGILEWRNSNSVKISGDDDVNDLSFGLTDPDDTVTVKGLIRHIDALTKSLRSDPCGVGGCNTNNGPALYQIDVRYNNKQAVFEWDQHNSLADVSLYLRIPKLATYTVRAGDSNEVCYGWSESDEYNASEEKNCLFATVYPSVHGLTAPKETCGESFDCQNYKRLCREIDALSADSRCAPVFNSHCNSGDPNDDFPAGVAGKIYACREDVPAPWTGGIPEGNPWLKNSPLTWDRRDSSFCGAISQGQAIKYDEVALEDIDCWGNTCIAVGREKADQNPNIGYAFRSTDAGETWSAKKYFGTSEGGYIKGGLARVKFVNQNEVYITGENRLLEYSSDAGVTFNKLPINVNGLPGGLVLGIGFLNRDIVYVGGGGQYTLIWRKPSSGVWNPVFSWSMGANGGVNSAFDSQVFASGSGHRAVFSTSVSGTIEKDQNDSWEINPSVVSCGGKRVSRIRRLSDNTFVIVTADPGPIKKGCVVKSNGDSVSNWNQTNAIKEDQDILGLDYDGSNALIATGSGGLVYRSTNNGANWSKVAGGQVDSRTNLNGAKFVNSQTVLAVGSGSGKDKLIYRSTDGGITWVGISNINQVWWSPPSVP